MFEALSQTFSPQRQNLLDSAHARPQVPSNTNGHYPSAADNDLSNLKTLRGSVSPPPMSHAQPMAYQANSFSRLPEYNYHSQ